jgi:hypothetical protein
VSLWLLACVVPVIGSVIPDEVLLGPQVVVGQPTGVVVGGCWSLLTYSGDAGPMTTEFVSSVIT